MISEGDLQVLQHAARIIEKKGIQGYNECVELVGQQLAAGMLVTYLRCIHGGLIEGEARPETPAQVKMALKQVHLLDDAEEREIREKALREARRKAEIEKEKQKEALMAKKREKRRQFMDAMNDRRKMQDLRRTQQHEQQEEEQKQEREYNF
jgi:hypothetical protein